VSRLITPVLARTAALATAILSSSLLGLSALLARLVLLGSSILSSILLLFTCKSRNVG